MRILVLFLALFGVLLGADKISIDEKIKAMIMVGLGAPADFDDLQYAGSVILFSRDFKTSDELKSLSARLHSMDLKVAIDEEGGKVSRLGKIGFITPSAYELGNSDISVAIGAYSSMAKNLKEHGIDINFAPVVDLHDIKSPIIGGLKRAYSSDPLIVAKMAHVLIKEHEKIGIVTALKHFVGHGSAVVDTHKGGGTAKADRKALDPYRKLIDNKLARSVMISHLRITNSFDENTPASLSAHAIDGLLRSKLHFGGVVFSDDMLMGALDDYTLEQKVIYFINAGGDIMVFGKNPDAKNVSAKKIFEIIKKALENGTISPARINKSYERIQKMYRF